MIYEELVNLDEEFARLRNTPIIANELDVETQEGQEHLNALLMMRQEGDSLSTVPSCDGGHLVGGQYEGVFCHECGTEVQAALERPLESQLWVRPPPGVTTLINPVAFNILCREFTYDGWDIIYWFCDPSYNPRTPAPPRFQMIDQYGFQRGINSFHANFDRIISALRECGLYSPSGPDGLDVFDWIEMCRDDIFCTHLPMPSRSGFVVEKAGKRACLDTSITKAIDALRMIVSASNTISPPTMYHKQARVAKAIRTLSNYYQGFFKDTLGGKGGAFRKHIYGGRTHFSARAVITSICERHKYDDLYMPWGLSVQVLRLHLKNRLLRMNVSPREIYQILSYANNNYDATIDKLFRGLIENSTHGRLPCMFQRNPTLGRGSAQGLWVPKIKTDVRDPSFSMSPLALKAPNADFDGDEMNFLLSVDKDMTFRLERLSPHLYAIDLATPRKLSGYLQMPSPSVSTISNWLNHPNQYS
jgi:hypothetical protein